MAPVWRGLRPGQAAAVAAGVLLLHLLLALAVWFGRSPSASGEAEGVNPGQAQIVFAELPRIRVAALPQTPTTPLMPQSPPTTSPAAIAAPPPVQRAPAPDAAATPVAAAPPVAATAPELPASGGPPPRYRTQVPAPARLTFRLQRGGVDGLAVLDWRLGAEAGGGYVVQLGSTASAGVGERWAWHSGGGFDADGLAPQRHTDRRGGRERRAVNFQREAGIVTWSASSHSEPLIPGLQDRVSWILQLAAILNAEPALRVAGQQIEIPVAGLRGEILHWRFDVRGEAIVELPRGTQAGALHLVHDALRPWGPRIELWLDPRREFLPLKMQFGARPPLEPLDLLRDDDAVVDPSTPGS
jgi:Protein of unknown function (DUF3108)